MSNLCIDTFFSDVYDPFSDEFSNVDATDRKIFDDFWQLLVEKKFLTEKQGNLLCKLLQKHKKFFQGSCDIDQLLSSQTWSQNFRVMDYSKKIFLNQDEDGAVWVCLQFPFALKTAFDQCFLNNKDRSFSIWDDEKRVRKLDFYKCNILQVIDFGQQNQFQISQEIFDTADQIDEIWQNIESLEKTFNIVDNKVTLINQEQSTQEYFDVHKTQCVEADTLLAKELGHVSTDPTIPRALQKIVSTDNNAFWIKDLNIYLDIYQKTKLKTCVILDRTSEYKLWVENFLSICDHSSISRNEIRVCFRESGGDSAFNIWVKEQGIGGKVDGGRIFIFLNTPAKWLYNNIESCKLILVNGLFPFTNKNTQNLLNCHPLVMYNSGNKPSMSKDTSIVEL